MGLVFDCPNCKRRVDVEGSTFGDEVTCQHCRSIVTIPGDAKVEYEDDELQSTMEQNSSSHSVTPPGDVEAATPRDFATLMSVGRLISFSGWFLVVVGIVLALIVAAVTERVTFALVGAPLVAVGILVVAQGQLISCLVSIERHTKLSCDLLRQISLSR